MVPCVWNKLFSKSFIIENKLNFPDYLVGEDVAFLINAFAFKPKLELVFTNIYYHWEHNGDSQPSLTHRYNFNYFKAHVMCREELLKVGKENSISEVEDYVYLHMIGFLIEFLYRVIDYKERELAFEELKRHIAQYDWSNKQMFFHSIFGIDYKKFMNSTAYSYFLNTNLFNHKEMVLKQYEVGHLGFRYIIKYIKAWAKYKLRFLEVYWWKSIRK